MRPLKITRSITPRDILERYLEEIGREERITVDEEIQLAQKIRGGDKKALEKMVRANLLFVISVSKQYQNRGLTLPDLVNEGNLGLVKAAQRFDETRGFKFISYAVWWIRQAILQAIAEQSRIVRLPLNKVGALNKSNKTFQKLEQTLEREPSPEELANALDIPKGEVDDLESIRKRHISLDVPVNEESLVSHGDLLPAVDTDQPDHNLAYITSLKKEITCSLGTLTPREREVLIDFYGLNEKDPITLDEIGWKIGRGRERVRQIKEKALKKLRNATRSKNLKPYL